MTGLAPKRQREDQDHTQEAIAKRAEYIVAELENLIRTDPGVREALAIASGNYSLDEKEAALMEVYQVLEDVLTRLVLDTPHARHPHTSLRWVN